MIDGGAVLARLDPATKIDPDWSRLVELRDLGRAAAEDWLAARHGAAAAPAAAAAAGRAAAAVASAAAPASAEVAERRVEDRERPVDVRLARRSRAASA